MSEANLIERRVRLFSIERWNIDTRGLKVGGKLWSGSRGWFTILWVTRRSVFVWPNATAMRVARRHSLQQLLHPPGVNGSVCHTTLELTDE